MHFSCLFFERNRLFYFYVYGIAFDNEEDLEAHLQELQEAKERDHRKIGKEQEILLMAKQAFENVLTTMINKYKDQNFSNNKVNLIINRIMS